MIFLLQAIIGGVIGGGIACLVLYFLGVRP